MCFGAYLVELLLVVWFRPPTFTSASTCISTATAAGFHDLVPPELISIFTPKELELLISGLPDIDLDDLQVGLGINSFFVGDQDEDSSVTFFFS